MSSKQTNKKGKNSEQYLLQHLNSPVERSNAKYIYSMSSISNNYRVTLKSTKHKYGKFIQERKKSFNIRKSAYLPT